ncbi:hypothetical protein [Streptomyces sp. NPDC002758]
MSAGFLAAIPFAGLLNVVQDWAGKRITDTQGGLLCGILLMLAFLIYGIGALHERVSEHNKSTDKWFKKFDDRAGTSIQYKTARYGQADEHPKQARELYEAAGKVIDSARPGDEIYAVNSFLEVFQQDSNPEIEQLQTQYLKRIEQSVRRRVRYHRLIQLESLEDLEPDRPSLSKSIEPSYLDHYRWMVGQRSDAAGNLVDMDAVPARYPISFVVLKRKGANGETGGSIIWQIDEHIQRNGHAEAARQRIAGIFVIKNPQGDLVKCFLDWFTQCNRSAVPLTLFHLRSEVGDV